MKINDLVIGKWYQIKYTSWIESFDGIALLKYKNPQSYPDGTLEFTCEDGETGYFGIEDIVGEFKQKD